LEAEKSFEEVNVWSHARKEDFVPIHELRSGLGIVEEEGQAGNGQTSSSAYIGSNLLTKLNLKPYRTER